MSVEVFLAGENCQADIRRLLSAYLAELSAYGDVDRSYPYFDSYWNEGEARWPYLINGDGAVVGFAFVNTVSPSGRGTDFSMAEFYVQPSARGKGHGLAAAAELFRKHNGVWELSVMKANRGAQNFWRNAIAVGGSTKAESLERKGEIIHRFWV